MRRAAMLGNNIENIPEGWTVANIEDIADIKTGSGDTQDKEEGGKYPFYVRSNTIERVNNYTFDGEGVLTSGDGVGVGKIYHYVNGKIHYHQRVYNIHNFKKNVIGRYFYEYFRHNFYSRVMRMSAKGSVDSVRLDMIAKMSVLVPPIEEQHKIVAILGSLNKKIELVERKITQTFELEKGLMQKLFSQGLGIQDNDGKWARHTEFKESKLGLIPSTWQALELSQLGEVIMGQSPKGETYNKEKVGTPLLNGPTEFTDKFPVKIQWTSKPTTLCQKGDVLLCVRGSSTGRMNISDDIYCIGRGLAAIRIKEGMDQTFLTFALSYLIDQIMRFTNGTTFPNLDRKTIGSMVLPKMPIEEQQGIAQILTDFHLKMELLKKQSSQLKDFKQGLMQKLLTGTWRVNINDSLEAAIG